MCKALDNTQTHLMFDSINLKTKQSALREYSIGSFLPREFSGDPCIYQIGYMDKVGCLLWTLPCRSLQTKEMKEATRQDIMYETSYLRTSNYSVIIRIWEGQDFFFK